MLDLCCGWLMLLVLQLSFLGGSMREVRPDPNRSSTNSVMLAAVRHAK